MPKELNLLTNERIDLEDFQYGTSTFSVDSLRAHVSRLVSGGYRGGFVLEGFRVEIPNNLENNSVTIYNGIALDRSGRLITNEEGDLFLNNSKYSLTAKLLDSVPLTYIMVEFTLEPVTDDQRAFWDPTYENPPIKDSGNDDVPQPKGKEFTVTVPTRKAQSWTVITSATGFEDTTDPNKIRIPVAIIPIDVGGTDNIDLTLGTDTEFAQTTLIEQPIIGTAATETLGYLRCADTRIFPNSGKVKLYNPKVDPTVFGGVRLLLGVTDNELTIISNDRENNILYVDSAAYVDSALNPWYRPRVGDVVRIESTTATGENFLSAGHKYDCRPMLFSFTDSVAATGELPDPFAPGAAAAGTSDRYTESRNNRYWAAASLVTNPDTTGDTLKNYPATSYGQQKSVTVPADRVENRLKQQQDFSRVLGALLQEMKYGVPDDLFGAASEDTTASMLSGGTLYKLGIRTADDLLYIVDTNTYFSQSLVGSYVRATFPGTANTDQRRQITEVIGDHVLVFGVAWTTQFLNLHQYTIEENYPSTLDPTDLKKFVDTKYTGSLEEVYIGRVDQFTDSYAEDLNRRLSINKVATITVGDGINTHGDFTGDTGLLAAFKAAFAKKRGAHIHIRRGTYNVSSLTPTEIGPNTVVTGEGKGATIINLIGSEAAAGATPNYFLVRDYHEKYKEAAPTLDEVLCSNITFKDLSIRSTSTGGASFSQHNYGYPLISNAPLDFFNSPGVVDNTINPGEGVWRPNVSVGVNGFSPVENFTLENVELLGGGNGDYITGTDVTYSVYLSTRNYGDTWEYINTGITFKGCTFDTHRGGTAILKGCRKVLVDGCEFRNREPADAVADGGAYAPVEGITFASIGGRSSDYYQNTTVNSDGDVLITNCFFLGELFDDGGSASYPSLGTEIGRGWINFTPSYMGQNVEISSCIFRGDLQGDSGSTVVSGPRVTQKGATARVVGVLNCSPFDIKVTGCNFHTVRWGVISQIGLMDISDCNFYNTWQSILMRPEFYAHVNNFATFSGTAVFGNDQNFWNANVGMSYYGQASIQDEPPTYTKLVCKNNTFMYCANGVVSGIYPWPYNNNDPSIVVSSCHFEGCAGSVHWDIHKDKTNYTDVYSGIDNGIRNNWRYVEISDSSFIRCTYASRMYGELKEIVNDHVNPYSDLRGAIQSFSYTNNTHAECAYSGLEWRTARTAGSKATNAGAFVTILGEEVNFCNNTFDQVTHTEGTIGNPPDAALIPSYSTSPIALLLTAGNVTAHNNSWTQCVVPVASQITHLKVGIIGSLSANMNDSYSFISNSIDVKSDPLVGIHNGIFINQLFPEVNDAGTLAAHTTGIATHVAPVAGCGVAVTGTYITPDLIFNDNYINLIDANFGFVAVQHQEGGYTGTATAGGFGTYGYSQYWDWNSATVNNNNIQILVNNLTAGNNGIKRQYGNDIGTTLLDLDTLEYNFSFVRGPVTQPAVAARYSFLGACNTAQPANYVACFDLRRCNRSTTADGHTANRMTGSVTVTGNTFHISDWSNISTTPSTASRNLQEAIGFRISKYPKVLNIKDNTFDRAPLLLRFTWNNPFMTTAKPAVTSFFTGYVMNIENNSFYNYRSPHTVDINPAVGWGCGVIPNPDPTANTEAGFAEILFSGNSVKAATGASTDADWDNWDGGVRFWFPDSDVWGQAGQVWGGFNPLWSLAAGFHVHQDNLKYKWTVTNNTLQDTYFRITKAQDGGIAATGGATFSTSSLLPAELCKNTNVEANYSLSLWQHNSLLVSAGSVTVGALAADKLSLFGHNNILCIVGYRAWDGATTNGLETTAASAESNIELVSFTIGVNWAASSTKLKRILLKAGSIIS